MQSLYPANQPVDPVRVKKIRFATPYCDNDGSLERKNYRGSVFIPGTDKDRAWINTDILGTLILIE